MQIPTHIRMLHHYELVVIVDVANVAATREGKGLKLYLEIRSPNSHTVPLDAQFQWGHVILHQVRTTLEPYLKT